MQFFLFCTISPHSLHSQGSPGGSVSVLSSPWNTLTQSRSKKGKMRQSSSSSSCLPPAPPCFLNLDSLCFTFKRLHWTFSWPDISRHTLHSPRSSTAPVGRMERVPWQPAVPNGLCSSALRSTVGKAAKLARAQYAASAAAAAAADRGVEGAERQRSWIWADTKLT